jgi:hypothetical protein
MNRVLALSCFYAAMWRHEWERFFAMAIKAAKKSADHARVLQKKGLKGERRCRRGCMPRGRSKRRKKDFILQNDNFAGPVGKDTSHRSGLCAVGA